MSDTLGTAAAIFGLAGPDLLAEEAAFFRAADPFGFILFARNVESPEQLTRLTGELRAAVGRDAPILIDQEGGRVQRMRAPHWREWAPPFDTVAGFARPEDAAEAMRLRMEILGRELSAVGIDVNCAPLGDVAFEGTHPFLKNRCYGETPETVALIARAVAEGLMAGGVLPVMKHMPGHGRSRLDTHHELPRVTASKELLHAQDFAPFKALNDLPMGMTGHLVFEAYDPNLPATQSPEMIRVIREEIGFDGLLMTDDMMMKALGGDLGSRTDLVIAAGCDLALHCNGELAEMEVVAKHAGAMGEKTRARAAKALGQRRKPEAADLAALDARLAALMEAARA